MNQITAQQISKIFLVACAALFSSLVVFNNLTDYQTNFEYVRHVMTMDTTGNAVQSEWRAVHQPIIWKLVYGLIIALEAVVALLCWAGVIQMLSALRNSSFASSKAFAIFGLSLGIAVWFGLFLGISGEWYLAWLSKSWNGIQPGFRIAAIFSLFLIYLCQAER
ncbi:DUF2165 domain-containing protein [Sansalvadorimonas sp. 2012CJ34-2]|uniref:DUF2165 domain-containing protein n=1 Tax=Parendozoicomonas callyspongiae TaxID=2942213 RepID=A0ABT0PKP9_9GAMM|nr:DUF2165 domain-containing protein [Sansalvadorimonas sp. 2012CJ34-2]MCL6271934.1 DUF2165 domain-containing protein [Sansalvadorimonas sp. 2012CJ34-2]